MQHEVTNGRDPISNVRLPRVGPYAQHEVTNGRNPICYIRLAMIGMLDET